MWRRTGAPSLRSSDLLKLQIRSVGHISSGQAHVFVLTVGVPPPPPLQAKAAIRELLPGGLREAISKVRSSVAYAISAIAHWDWPEAWPQLFTLLMEMLVSGDVNAVHGAMRVLTGVL